MHTDRGEANQSSFEISAPNGDAWRMPSPVDSHVKAHWTFQNQRPQI